MEGVGLDPLLAHLSQEGKDRVVFDPPGYHNNIQCGLDGRIAMMSRNFVHIYEPHLQFMQTFTTSWVRLQSKLLTVSFQYPASNIQDMSKLAPFNESRISFKKIRWIPNVVNGLDPLLLLCLLNDGSFLAFMRGDPALEETVELSNCANDHIVMKNYTLVYDFDRDYSAAAANRINTFEIIEKQGGGLTLATSSGLDILLWRVTENTSTSKSNIIDLTMHSKFTFGNICNNYVLTVPVIVSSIATMAIDETTCYVIGILRHGCVVLLKSIWSLEGSFSLIELDRVEFRFKVLDYAVAVAGTILVATHTHVIALDIMHDKMVPLWESQFHSSQITCLMAKKCSSSRALLITSSSLNGEIKYWKATDNTIIAVDAQLCEHAQHGVYGLADDPLNCLTIYSYCAPKVLENTREVQLNYSLGYEQTKLSFIFNRHLQRDWIMSPVTVATYLMQTLLEVVNFKAMTFLGLSILDSMETLKRNFRKLPIKPLPPMIREVQVALESGLELPIKKKKKSNTGKQPKDVNIEDIEDEEDDEFSEDDYCSDDYEKVSSSQRRSSKSARSGKSCRNNGPSDGGGAGMTLLLDRLREYVDPDPITLSILGLNIVIDASLISTACLRHNISPIDNNRALEDRLAYFKDSASREELIEAFFVVEEDLEFLQKKYLLWQLCFHILGAIISMRLACLPDSNQDKQRFQAFGKRLLKVMTQSRALIICQRFLGFCQELQPEQFSRGLLIVQTLISDFPPNSRIACDISHQIDEYSPINVGPERCPICTISLPKSSLPQCSKCQIEMNRCCYSFEIISLEHNISCCTLCASSVNSHWLLENSDLCELLYGSHFPICPYCGVFMHEIV